MNNELTIDKLQDAWQLASTLHTGQSYGGQNEGDRVEYINHIGSVVFEINNALNYEQGLNRELSILCAILHDTLEDTEATFESIQDAFGVQIALGVLALTKNESLETKEQQMLDSLERIKAQPKEVWAVKLADRICNLYAPPFYWNNEKKEKYMEEAQLIYDHLKDGSNYLSERLLKKIESYKRFITA